MVQEMEVAKCVAQICFSFSSRVSVGDDEKCVPSSSSTVVVIYLI